MGKCPLKWGQSLYILGNLLAEVRTHIHILRKIALPCGWQY